MEDSGSLFASFLPLQLLGRLYGERGELPAAASFEAAVMFVDVSRFTALVEQLARRGHEGLEAVPSLLSYSYGRCAEHVEAGGGEVINFAGDSLVAYWPAGDDPQEAVGAAVACAEAIFRDKGIPNSMGEDELALHAGIGAGTLWTVAVGSPPVWNFVVGGNAVVDAARQLSEASNRGYALSKAAAIAISEKQDMETPGGLKHQPAITTPPASWLANFLPLQIRDVVAEAEKGGDVGKKTGDIGNVASGLDALADVRPVSVMFVRFAELKHDVPPSLEQHHELCQLLQRITRDFGGPSGELLYDDKGLVFLATFGARGSFHRDDPRRAVGAACAIKAALRHTRMQASIGMATGEAMFRVVGSKRRRQFMVLGSPVNRAARLMLAVEDDILCDAPTERAVRSAFTFERRGTLQLEGLGEMTPVFRPLKARPKQVQFAEPIGRERQLAVLRDAFEEVSKGDNRLIAVLGEPGIGKTTLVTAFSEKLRSNGSAVFISRAERDNRRTSLLAWRHVLEALVGLPPDCAAQDVVDALKLRLKGQSEIADRLPLLNEVLGTGLPQNDQTMHLHGAHRADATMRLIGELLDVIARRPAVLVLEDCQWIDSASWRLLEWVLATQSSLMVVICVRLGEIPEQLQALIDRSNGQDEPEGIASMLRLLELPELDRETIFEVLKRVLDGVSPDTDVGRRISSLAAGNPLFAEEIALALKSEGLIAERDGAWRAIRSVSELEYFEGIERVIRERVDRLHPHAQNVLKAAAVVGRSFTFAELEVLCGSKIDDSIEAALAARLIRSGDEHGKFEFHHDLIRDVVYDSIPAELRKRLHAALADWMEANRPGAASDDIAVLLKHCEAAGIIDKAVKYADLAATKALQTGSYREVEAFVRFCLEHEPPRPWRTEEKLQAVRRRRQLADAHYSLGDIHSQGVVVRQALAVAGNPVPRTALATLVRLAGEAAIVTARQAFPYSDDEGKSSEDARLNAEIARCLNQAAVVDYFELKSMRSVCSLLGAVRFAERTGTSQELAVSSAQLACGLGTLGLRRASERFMRRAEYAAEKIADPSVHSHLCMLDALWRVGNGEWPDVYRRLEQAQELALKAGDQLRWCNAQVMRFWYSYYRGSQDELEPITLALLARAQNAGNVQQEIWALRCKALYALSSDRPREAADILKLVNSAMPNSVDQAARIASKGALALALARMGKSAESVDASAETLELLDAMGRPASHSILVGISSVLEVLLRGREASLSRQYEQWMEWEARALVQLRRYARAFPIGGAQLNYWTGVQNWLGGKRERALADWQRALAIARKYSLRRDEALIAAEIRRREDRVPSKSLRQ